MSLIQSSIFSADYLGHVVENYDVSPGIYSENKAQASL
jgi:hypothetical protein